MLTSVDKKAAFLCGLEFAFELQGYPPWIDKEEFATRARTAKRILSGDGFKRMLVWNMAGYADSLIARAIQEQKR